MKRALLLLASVSSLTVAAHAFDAAAAWDNQCAKCHGQGGAGDTKMGKKLGVKDFTDANVQGGFTDDEVFKAIKEGTKDKNGKVRMKAGEGLSDDDINAMVQYVRSLKK